MPVIQLDWVKLIARFADVTGLYFLTHRQASLLLSLTEQLTWEKTYRAFDYDFDDWDTVQLEVADLQRYLTMPVNLVDLIGYIDEIEELLIALQSTANCCDGNTDISDGDYYTDSVVDGVGDVPQNIIDAGYATGVSDWEGFDDYKCMVSHVIVDSMESKLRMLAPFVDSAGVIIGGVATIASIVSVLFSGGLSVLALGIIAATGSTALLYKLLTSGSFLLGIADDVSDDHNELACAVYNGDGSADSLEELNAKIDELYDVPVTTILQNLNLGPELKALYAGRHNEQDIAAALEEAGYEVDDFDCICEELEPHQLIYNPDLTLGLAGWTVLTPFTWAATQVNVGDEETTYTKFISADSVVVSDGYTKLELRTWGYSNPTRDSTWYYRVRRASDDALIGTVNQTCNSKDGQFHQKIHTKMTVEAGEKYYIEVALTTNYANSYAVTMIEGWESIT